MGDHGSSLSASTLSPVSVTSRRPGNMDSCSIGQLLKTLNSIVVSLSILRERGVGVVGHH